MSGGALGFTSPHGDAGQDGGVIRDARVVFEDGHSGRNISLVDDRVRVGVDVDVIRDRHAIAENQATTVVQENVSVNNDIVAHLHVIPKREFNVVKAFEVAAAALEDMGCEQPPELHGKVNVATQM
jgi:hypothetical protein